MRRVYGARMAPNLRSRLLSPTLADTGRLMLTEWGRRGWELIFRPRHVGGWAKETVCSRQFESSMRLACGS
jgi:hypothetical protein